MRTGTWRHLGVAGGAGLLLGIAAIAGARGGDAQEPPAAQNPPAQTPPPAGAGQQGAPGPDTSVLDLPDSVLLQFEREVFDYPEYARRNPFRSLVLDGGAGPRYEDLRLIGIVQASDPSLSIASFALRTSREIAGEATLLQQAAQGDTTAATTAVSVAAPSLRTFRARPGETIGGPGGNTRVIEIQRDQVIVEVTEFGVSDRRVMRIVKQGQGGPR